MLKIPSIEVNKLIDAVLAKHQWTQWKLAAELHTTPETISRWRAGSGIHQGHYDELLRLSEGDPIKTELIKVPLRIPFSVTIPRSSLRVTVDKNGDFNISGILEA